MSRKAGKVYNAVTTLLVAAVVVLAMLLVGVRLVGLQPFAVLSGSMEPAYKVGSLIYVKSVEPGDVQVGDPITFVLNEDLVVATHRVIRVDAPNQHFYTKGDANEAADASPVHYKNLIGKPVFTIAGLGYVSSFLNTQGGSTLAIAAATMIVILVFIPDLLKKAEAADNKKKNASNTHKRPEV